MSLPKIATFVAIATATLLAIVKLIAGILSGSVGLLASAIDSLLDVVISIFNSFAISISESKANEQYNYGKGKIEALAGFLEGLIIAISAIYIFYGAIEKLFQDKPIEYLDISIAIMIFSLIITIFLFYFLLYVAKKTNSLVIKADALHYKTDLLTNAATLFALSIIAITGWEIVDSIFGGIIACYILYNAYSLLLQSVRILLDHSVDQKYVNQIKEILEQETEIQGYHLLRTRISASWNFVEAHLIFKSEHSFTNAHQIAHNIEDKIKELDKAQQWSITLHLDPDDDLEYDLKSS
ncbi:cation-efflux pump [Helicobacter monodelphidis]|uniref:cation diffusion facilitator family transporter n=1 Tax=Helicobacter sp. 15-1451 TaxID=2004995 RepID=UPI000DCE2B97|nr:cation diffusion facilitator family transporter [Helicobacter sp. 15-1451]RAX58413.1 cation-efflux pump [Helicobacter sp. 15-1451]